MTTEERKVFNQVVEALEDAFSHLNYCGYGDSWERDCAYQDGLPDKLAAAITAAEELTKILMKEPK